MREPSLSRRAALGVLALGALAIVPGAEAAPEPPRLPERVSVRRPDGSTSELGFEEYLKGVLPAEMPAAWPDAALEAQAVVARSYAAAYLAGRGAICATTSCQVWDGARRTARTDTAVDATRGQVLLHGGAIAWAFYSSTCGGHTAAGSGRAARYCRPVRCWLEPDGRRASLDLSDEAAAAAFWGERVPAFCARSPHFRHTVVLGRAATVAVVDQFLPAIATCAPRYRAGSLGELRGLEVVERNGSGRVRRLGLVGTGGSWEVSGEMALRSILRRGPTAAPHRSTGFLLGPDLRLRGGGYGHGIGLCQHGARGMAERGHGRAAILRHYYDEVELAAL